MMSLRDFFKRKPSQQLPSITAAIGALVLFYIGYVEVRGFEGAAYPLLSIFLFLFATAAFAIAKKPLKMS